MAERAQHRCSSAQRRDEIVRAWGREAGQYEKMLLERVTYGGQEIVFRLEHMLRAGTGAEATTAPPIIEPYPTGNAVRGAGTSANVIP